MPTPPLHVVFADADLCAVDKPAGLLSVPGRGPDKQDCLLSRLQALYPDVQVVHRLDQATSGLMLFARHPLAQKKLSQSFEQRQVHKRYQAWVDGLMPLSDDWHDITLPILADWPRRPLRVISPLGQASHTRWRCVEHSASASRLELEPLTGRTHQLRVHMQATGHPILGDALYASAEVHNRSPRLLLHAHQLRLRHPVSLETLAFESPVPWGPECP